MGGKIWFKAIGMFFCPRTYSLGLQLQIVDMNLKKVAIRSIDEGCFDPIKDQHSLIFIHQKNVVLLSTPD